jgi:hypothetical protein
LVRTLIWDSAWPTVAVWQELGIPPETLDAVVQENSQSNPDLLERLNRQNQGLPT